MKTLSVMLICLLVVMPGWAMTTVTIDSFEDGQVATVLGAIAGEPVSVLLHDAEWCSPAPPAGVLCDGVSPIWRQQDGAPCYAAPPNMPGPWTAWVIKLTAREAGTYTVPIKCDLGMITLHMEVIGDIPEPDAGFGFYWEPNRYARRQHEGLCLRMMAHYGANTFACYAQADDTWCPTAEEALRRQLDGAVARGMDLRAERPMALINSPLTNADIDRMKATTAVYPEHWPTLHQYGYDEPGCSPEMRTAWAKWRQDKVASGWTGPVCTSASGSSWFALGDQIDWWINRYDTHTDLLRRQARIQGVPYYGYSPYFRSWDPGEVRFRCGIWTWANELDGFLVWAFSHDACNLLTDDGEWQTNNEREVQQFSFVLSGPDGPLPSMGLMGFRAAVTDYRLLHTVECEVLQSENGNLVGSCAQWLNYIGERANRWELTQVSGVCHPLDGRRWQEDRKAPGYDEVRLQAIEAIRALREGS